MSSHRHRHRHRRPVRPRQGIHWSFYLGAGVIALGVVVLVFAALITR